MSLELASLGPSGQWEPSDTGVKWSLQGHSGHGGPFPGRPWASLCPPLRERGGDVLQVGVWGHHTDPALECSEQKGGRGGGGGLPTQYCPVTSVPVCAGSSVTAASEDEQAVGLRSLLAWVVLMQPGGELWPNQGRAYTPLVAVSKGCLPVTSRGRRKWAGQPTGTPKPSSMPPISSHCPGLHRLHSACLKPSNLSRQSQKTGDTPWRPLEHLNKVPRVSSRQPCCPPGHQGAVQATRRAVPSSPRGQCPSEPTLACWPMWDPTLLHP